jgi:hypothetical protein
MKSMFDLRIVLSNWMRYTGGVWVLFFSEVFADWDWVSIAEESR